MKLKISVKKTIIFLTIALVILLIFGQKFCAKTYVRLFHNHLEAYAERLMEQTEEDIESDRYGLWKVTCYKEKTMVEFSVGGSGLVFNSRYWGFYYSPDDTHRAFQGCDIPMKAESADETIASWEEENTDNGGKSERLLENWFWYEAWF